jgi:hypothetical protein
MGCRATFADTVLAAAGFGSATFRDTNSGELTWIEVDLQQLNDKSGLTLSASRLRCPRRHLFLRVA